MAAFDRMKALGFKIIRVNRPDRDDVIAISDPNTNTIYHNIAARRGVTDVLFMPIDN